MSTEGISRQRSLAPEVVRPARDRQGDGMRMCRIGVLTCICSLWYTVKKKPRLRAGLFLMRTAALPFLAAIPVVHFLCRLILRVAIALLQPAFELVLLAVDDIQIVI